ncbi:MAG: glycosyltransferase [Cyanobacteria bacterium P01_C01_bin.72]
MELKYALVHEWLTPLATGGSELVVQEILKHVEADLYALIDFESVNPQSYLYQRSIQTTFLQKFPQARQGIQKYLPLLPLAIEQLDVNQYDVILSSSHAVAKGVLTNPHQLHICYCHTPMRYAWDLTFDYLRGDRKGKGIQGLIARYILHRLREWDVISANRVDYFIANSKHTAKRIWRCYRRPAKVIYPPVALDKFDFQPEKADFYLTISRLVSYKQICLIVKAFNQLKKPLVIIGSGSQLSEIRQLAEPHVQVLGWQPQDIVQQYITRAKAFVYAACEDFGIALVEAQACGTPVIAYGKGGALETVKDIRQCPEDGTGLLFEAQQPEALIAAVNSFEQLQSQIEPEHCRQQAKKFSPAIFQQTYLQYIADCYQEWQSK